MKSLFIALVILIVYGLPGCGGPSVTMPAQEEKVSEPTPPKWYTTIHAKTGRIIGFGQSHSRDQAKSQALADISSQLDVQVKSQIKSSVAVVDNGVTRAESTKYELSATQRLQNTRVVTEEASSGITYIALEFDARPTEQITADQLLAEWAGQRPAEIIWKGHRWLANSDFVSKLHQQLVSSNGLGTREVHIALTRRNDRWQIGFDNAVVPIENSDLMRLLGIQTADPSFRLGVFELRTAQARTRLKVGDAFFLKFDVSKPGDYFTLFNLYHDGRLAVIQDSQKTEHEQSFPSGENRKKGFALSAQTVMPKEPSVDVYLAVMSSNPLDTSAFESVSDRQVGNAYHLDILLDLLERKIITDVAATRINIRP